MIVTLAQTATTAAASGSEGYFLWGCILFAVALVLLALELFVPSGGLIGILAGMAAIGSVVAFFKYDSGWGIGVALTYIILTPIILIFMFKLWINSPLGTAMILGTQQDLTADQEEATRSSEQARRERLAQLEALIGAQGVAESALRPVGTVRIAGERLDAIAETGVIEANTPVIVATVYDNQIKVRPA